MQTLGGLNWLNDEVCLDKLETPIRPRGKESTEVRITQNKGKESENSYQKLK